MTRTEWLELATGLLQLALAAAVLRHVRGFGGTFPWLGALIVFFALRGTQRVYAAMTDDGDAVFGVAGDVVLIAVLVLLLVGLDRTVRGLRLSSDEAEAQAFEYGRALRDYRVLMRHRIANPLTVIRGAASTLREVPLDEESRRALLESIEAASYELERVALEPAAASAEERALRPQPQLGNSHPS